MEQETDLSAKVGNLLSKAVLYATQTKDVLILDATEKASRVIADIISSILIFILIHLVVIFASIGLGWYIGQCIDNLPMGFLFVGLIYLILLATALAINKSVIQATLINISIKKLIHG